MQMAAREKEHIAEASPGDFFLFHLVMFVHRLQSQDGGGQKEENKRVHGADAVQNGCRGDVAWSELRVSLFADSSTARAIVHGDCAGY